MHRHIGWNLGDDYLKKHPQLIRHLEKKGQVTMLVKGASYLLWRGDFSRIRELHPRSPRVDAVGLDRHPADVRASPPAWSRRPTASYDGAFLEGAQATTHDEDFIELWKAQKQRAAAVPVRLRRQEQAGAPGRHATPNVTPVTTQVDESADLTGRFCVVEPLARALL